MPTRKNVLRIVFLFLLFWSGSVPAPDMQPDSGLLLSRGRVSALLTALFYYNTTPDSVPAMLPRGNGARPPAFGSLSPSRTVNIEEREKITAFARSLIYQGGFFPTEIYQLLGIENPTAARIARISRQIDDAAKYKPAPWEVAGRVGRSGMRGASDHWAMAPGGDAGRISTPGTLAYLPALAIVYAGYPQDGIEAAAQLAILKDDDMRAAPAARVAESLLTRILVGDKHDKDAWLRAAAADSGDAETEYDIRAVRAKEWQYLRDEECAMGRLEKPLFLWYKGTTYDQIMQQGRQLLRSKESLAYLAALSAATYGIESLPRAVLSAGSRDAQLIDLTNSLHDLAVSDAVLRVEPEEAGN